jgi:hypothetical protein
MARGQVYQVVSAPARPERCNTMFTVTPDVDGGTRKAAAGAVTASAAINSTAAAAPGGSLED